MGARMGRRLTEGDGEGGVGMTLMNNEMMRALDIFIKILLTYRADVNKVRLRHVTFGSI